jgi:hypothetical protein
MQVTPSTRLRRIWGLQSVVKNISDLWDEAFYIPWKFNRRLKGIFLLDSEDGGDIFPATSVRLQRTIYLQIPAHEISVKLALFTPWKVDSLFVRLEYIFLRRRMYISLLFRSIWPSSSINIIYLLYKGNCCSLVVLVVVLWLMFAPFLCACWWLM